MLPTSWWICVSLKPDREITNFTLPKYCRVELFIFFKSSLSLMNSMPYIFLFVAVAYLKNKHRAACEDREQGFPEEYSLACFVRCFTLSFCSHKTPWTWEKTNYSFRRRCPGAFLSLSRPPGYITCVPQGWLWHGSCHWWGPWGLGCCSKQGGLLSLIACPPEQESLNLGQVCTQHPWPQTQLPLDFAITLVMGTDMSTMSILSD